MFSEYLCSYFTRIYKIFGAIFDEVLSFSFVLFSFIYLFNEFFFSQKFRFSKFSSDWKAKKSRWFYIFLVINLSSIFWKCVI